MGRAAVQKSDWRNIAWWQISLSLGNHMCPVHHVTQNIVLPVLAGQPLSCLHSPILICRPKIKSFLCSWSCGAYKSQCYQPFFTVTGHVLRFFSLWLDEVIMQCLVVIHVKKLVIRCRLCCDAQQELETASQVSMLCGLVLSFVNCKEKKPIRHYQLSCVRMTWKRTWPWRHDTQNIFHAFCLQKCKLFPLPCCCTTMIWISCKRNNSPLTSSSICTKREGGERKKRRKHKDTLLSLYNPHKYLGKQKIHKLFA